MKKISLNIFFVLLILFFTNVESIAKEESGCSVFDILCKITGKGSEKDSTKKMTDEDIEKIIKQNEKEITDANTEINTIFYDMYPPPPFIT